MQHGFVKVAAVTPKIKVADPEYNLEAVLNEYQKATKKGAKIIVFPELVLTGYTCNDLFLQEKLLEEAKKALIEFARFTVAFKNLSFIGLPLVKNGKLYNVAAAVGGGRILGFIPKINLPNYAEFYEARHFTKGNVEPEYIDFNGEAVPFGSNIIFEARGMEGLKVGCEICEDLWVANPPSTRLALNGATVIVNLSASNETVGKDQYRSMLVNSTSARLVAGYIYTSIGDGESTQDIVFGGSNIIAENGCILRESKRFNNETIYGDIDIHKLVYERRRMNTYEVNEDAHSAITVKFDVNIEETELDRFIDKAPFVPNNAELRDKRCEEILAIQASGLKKRYEHTGCKTAVIGISGGLDSTLALLVTAKTYDMLGLDHKNIFAVTMPCFGTTGRTYNNSIKLGEILDATVKVVDIKESVTKHFDDIGQDMDNHDVTYENGQARERTQVLMDIANKENGLVIGTGDMSELALGWATYNGDHMSMYGVNVGVPKTLVRHLVRFYADTCKNEELSKVLYDVLDTPVSPELLPPKDGEISQKTEDLVGPYELHDFFLYNMLRQGFSPAKVYRLAKIAFDGEYDDATILKWLKTFYRRFFAQQFKRSCLPDGPKVGSVAVSPRGDLRMPSDASANIWLREIDNIV